LKSKPILKNSSAIILLFIANSISGLAQGVSMLAIPWYFVKQGQMSQFGIVYILTTVLALFWVPYTGTFVDRFNRKKIFLVTTAICGSSILMIALTGFLQSSISWWLVALVFLITFLNYNIHYPNLYAFVQEITEPEHYGKITSYIEIQGQVTSVLAGAGGAFLLEGISSNGKINILGFNLSLPFNFEPWEIYEIFLLDASTYFAAFLIISLITYQPIATRNNEGGSAWNQIKTGFNYLKKHANIFLFGVASFSVFVGILLEGFYLGANYVKKYLKEGGDVYASSEMYYAMGAIFAGLAIRYLFKRVSLPMSVIIMIMLASIAFAMKAFTANIGIYYLMMLITGITNAGIRIQRTTYLFSNIPNQFYGRASSIFIVSNILFRILFLSFFALPFFQEGIRVVYPFAILSFFMFLSGLLLIYYYPTFIRSSLQEKNETKLTQSSST